MRLLLAFSFLYLTGCVKQPNPGIYCNPETYEGIMVVRTPIHSTDYLRLDAKGTCIKLMDKPSK